MRKSGGGIGFIVLLIVGAIVAILTMRAWLSVAPTAEQIMGITGAAGGAKGGPADSAKGGRGEGSRRAGSGSAGGPSADSGRAADGSDQAPPPGERPGVLPDLRDMKQATDEHADEVKKAVEESGR